LQKFSNQLMKSDSESLLGYWLEMLKVQARPNTGSWAFFKH